MLSMMPYISLFMMTMVMGTILSISSPQWIFIWVGLELNLMSFMPLITSSHNRHETEASIKYFLTQATGSSLILLGGLVMKLQMPEQINNLSILIIIVGLSLKLGAAPFHFWFPQVMCSMSWPLCILISTWQKIAPLSIIYMLCSNSIVLMFGVMSAFIGAFGGLNQTQLRPLLAYSSIGHVGWMFSVSFLSQSSSLIYFFIYVTMSLSIMAALWLINSSTRNISSMMKLPLSFSILLLLMFMSLGGIPPFLGFFPKWLVIQTLSMHSMFLIMFMLISAALINLFYYLSISTNMIMLSYSSMSWGNISTSNMKLAVLMFITFSPYMILFT